MSSNFTQADVEAMAQAIKGGVTTVTRGDRSITYRSMSELIQAYKLAKAELESAQAAQSGAGSVPYSVADWTVR